MKNRTGKFLLLGLVAGSMACGVACGPEPKEEIPEDAAERYAAAFCGAVFACDDCVVRTEHASKGDCEIDVQARYQEGFDSMADKTTFNQDCLDRIEQQLERGDGCSLIPLPYGDCELLTGSGAIGDSCETVEGSAAVGVSTCKNNLVCAEGKCFASPIVTYTTQKLGEACALPNFCVDGLACVDGVCIERNPAGEGEPCGAGGFCDPGLYCGTENICKQDVALGEECDMEGTTIGCKHVQAEGWGQASWCVAGECSGPQPGICHAPG